VYLEDTKILAKEDHYFKRKIREAIEIIKHRDNLNKDGGLEINENWLSLINNRLHIEYGVFVLRFLFPCVFCRIRFLSLCFVSFLFLPCFFLPSFLSHPSWSLLMIAAM
jgi:hypothetical protein